MAVESKHTPGPWVYLQHPLQPSVRSPKYRNTIAVSTAYSVQYTDEVNANARLIAAAPDLLEALTDILRVIATDELIPESVSYMMIARQAIAKATGETA